MTAALSLSDINLSEPGVFVQGYPHEQWKLLRREAPVFLHPAMPPYAPAFWCITKYDDIIAVSRDPHTFISGRGITMFGDPAVPDPAFGRLMIMTDPPRHVRLRRLVNKAFTPRAVAALEPHVRAIAREIVDGVAGQGRGDFVTDIAAKLPLAVICEMMGVPRADWQMMFDLSNRTIGAGDPEYSGPGTGDQGSMMATFQLMQYFATLTLDRRAHPGGTDLMSVLVGADIDGQHLDDQELMYFGLLLIIAGNETTRNATTGGMLALMQHPEQRARLLAEPALLPTAVEEIIRWTSPVIHMARVATRDVELRGCQIRAGEKLVMWYPSANRDEEVFPDADTFDVGRTPNEHLAFGIGEHFCLGAGLARLELRVIFEELLARIPDMELAGPVDRLRSNFVGGIKHMPVVFTPAAKT